MSAPLIGVTTARTLSSEGYPLLSVVEAYTQALVNAGAMPVLIPLGIGEAILQELITHLDGVLFTGGGDVHPDQYRSQAHPLVKHVDEDRDRVEIYLVKEAVRTGLPFLGICRGLQVINIALGGSLYEDLRDQRPDTSRHDFDGDQPRDYLAHTVQVVGQSLLAKILKSETEKVNSFHHQGIRLLADGLRAGGHAPDGVIEAIELPEHPFGLAVQWHPEWLQAHLSMRTLFRAFVSATDKTKP